mmetsp:Transcript_39942/g.79989  ORF Transcript_39942/g.79989 Transcript_39942/m.79989 type:complete len:114 (+) Transcript_39942:663-1004(+)
MSSVEALRPRQASAEGQREYEFRWAERRWPTWLEGPAVRAKSDVDAMEAARAGLNKVVDDVSALEGSWVTDVAQTLEQAYEWAGVLHGTQRRRCDARSSAHTSSSPRRLVPWA